MSTTRRRHDEAARTQPEGVGRGHDEAGRAQPGGFLRRDERRRVTVTLNGRTASGWCEPRDLLSDFIRHVLGATGTHVGCEHGVCGACTVRVDGVASRACLMLAVQAEDRCIDTVEGLAPDKQLGDLQEAFRRHHALQCGFCTAGILMSCAHYLERVPEPSAQQVRDMLSGHLCRCTGYTPIVAAVLDVAARRARHGKPDAPALPGTPLPTPDASHA